MRRLLVVLAAAFLLGAGTLAPATAASNDPRVFPPTSHPYGSSYGEWQARWFKWLMEIPVPVNPALDETGANCNVGQTGRVWFSASTINLTTTRSCTISEKQAVLVFAVGNECSDIEPPPFFGDNEADLRECAAAGFDEFWPTPPSVTVDGVAVPDITRFRMQTPGVQVHASGRQPVRSARRNDSDEGGLRRDRGHAEAAVAGAASHRDLVRVALPSRPGSDDVRPHGSRQARRLTTYVEGGRPPPSTANAATT